MSIHSKFLKEIFDHPKIAFENVTTVFVPASGMAIKLLLTMLSDGICYASKTLSKEFLDLLQMLDININPIVCKEEIEEEVEEDKIEEEETTNYDDEVSNEVVETKSYNCIYCPRSFEEKKLLKRHRYRKHKGRHITSNSQELQEQHDDTNNMICKQCQYRATSMHDLKMHYITVHQVKKLTQNLTPRKSVIVTI